MRSLLPLLALLAALPAQEPAPVDFEREVQPILSDACYVCHGPDPEKRKGDLRLDTREGALAKAIVPGKPETSELYRRLTTDDADDRMPPAKTKRTLSAGQIAILRRWISEGAPWKTHWAFVPPRRVEGSIDSFVQERLRREGLRPSPEAGRATLLRRVSLDLTGIPPTPEEVDAFLADPSSTAYEKVVDRLLA